MKLKLHVPSLLNTLTMVFPLIAWWKHKKNMKHNNLHRFMRIHMPISIIYHLMATLKGMHGKHDFRDTLLHLDILCIHTSSFIGAFNSICKVFRTRHLLRNTYLTIATCTHSHAFIKNIQRDQTFYRFSTLVFNSCPIFMYKNGLGPKLTKYGFIAFLLYLNAERIVIGHSCFHVVLYCVYDTYFSHCMINAE